MRGNFWLRRWQQLGITTKFGLAYGVLMVIIVAVALTSYATLSTVRRQMETTITTSFEVQRLVLEMDQGLQRARILERDFFWRWPTVGYAQAHDTYAQVHRQKIADITTLGASLQQTMAASTVSDVLRQNEDELQQFLAGVNRYAQSFNETTDLVAQLAAEPDGADVILLRQSKTLYDALPQAYDINLLLLYQQMQNAEKNYLTTHQALDLEPLFDGATRFRAAINKMTSITDAVRSQILAYLDDYVATANKVKDLDAQIKSKLGEFDQQAEATDPIAQALITSANQDVQLARDEIAQTNQTATIILGLTILLAIGLTVLVAVVMNNAITRKIIRLTAAAANLQNGKLQERVQVDSGDELGQLGSTFNAMAARLQETLAGLEQELVQRTRAQEELRHHQEHLEELVNARTAELAEQKEAVQREKQSLESLITNSPVAIVVMSLDLKVVSWNPAAERLFGYTQAEATGKSIDDLVIAPTMQAEARTFSQQTEAGTFIHSFTQRCRKDGSLVDVELLGVPIVLNGEQIGAFAMYHDITELERARQEAEAANRTKSAFLATMSHEIRTPMNGIIGMTSLLLDTELTDEQRDYAETIRSSGETLLTIINDILDFSKIEAGKMELENQPFDLRECIESALDLVATSARNKRLELAYVIDTQVPMTLIGDVTRLRQILLNLLSNAIKFTPKGEVVVSVETESKGPRYALHVSVRDTGIGIPADRMERLFQSFSQVDASTTRKYGGTGLGLVISKRLCEIMDGTMWVESEVNQGSTFHFTIQLEAAPAQVRVMLHSDQPQLRDRHVLIVDDNDTNRRILVAQTRGWNMLPRATAFPKEASEWIQRGDPFDIALLDMQMPDMDGLTLATEIRQYRDAESLPIVILSSLDRREAAASTIEFAAYLTKPIKQSVLYDTLLKIFSGQSPEIQARTSAEKLQFDTHLAQRLPLRILVAEDNVVNQKLAQQMLQKMGYRPDYVGNGVEVLEALERQPYDVVLMDVQMPDMDGLEATRRIRKQWAPGKGPHIIAMTANAMQGDRDMCLAAGMDDYLSKPIQVKALQVALERWGQHGPVEAAPDVAVPASENAVDWSVLDQLRELQEEGEPDFVQDMIDLYLSNSPSLIEAMQQAITQHKADGLKSAAHTLKGNSNSLGAKPMGVLCLKLEQMGRSGTVEGAEPLFADLRREFERVQQAFKSKERS